MDPLRVRVAAPSIIPGYAGFYIYLTLYRANRVTEIATGHRESLTGG